MTDSAPRRGGLAPLRDLLYQEPSAQTWRNICRCLEGWPAEQPLGVGLDYAEQHLSRWPSGLRVAPPPWVGAPGGRAAPPGALGLARALNLALVRLDAERLRGLLHDPALQHIQSVNLCEVELAQGALSALAGARLPAGVRHLGLHRPETPEEDREDMSGWLSLLRAPWMSQLTSLWLCGLNFWPRQDIWSQGVNFSNLKALHMPAVYLFENRLSGLLEVLPQGLETLHLSAWYNIGADYGALAASEGFQGLRRLLLQDVRLSEAIKEGGWGPLVEVMPKELTSLSVAGSVLGADGFCAMLGLAQGSLRALDLSYTLGVTDEAPDLSGVQPRGLAYLDLCGHAAMCKEGHALLAQPWLGSLRGLRLADCAVEDGALAQLASQVPLEALESLELGRNEVTAQGLAALLEALPGGLRSLSLWSNPLGDEGARVLARGDRLKGLERLNLADASLGDAGARALAGCGALAGVRDLVISNNPEITEAGWRALLASPHLHPRARRQVRQAAAWAGVEVEPERSGGPPAAHSMDTTWFAVDSEGNVGVFDSGEAGAVPSVDSIRSHASLYNDMEELLEDRGPSTEVMLSPGGLRLPWQIKGPEVYCGPGQSHRDHLLALRGLELPQGWWSQGRAVEVASASAQVLAFGVHLPQIEVKRLKAQDACQVHEIPWEGNFGAARRGAYFFEHLTENWASGPYGRHLVPQEPLRLEDLPEGLREELSQVRLPVDFSKVDHVQPLEHMRCNSWQSQFMDMKGNLRPMDEAPHEDEGEG